MYQFLTKNGQTLAFGLGLLLIIIFLAIAVPSASGLDFTTMENADKLSQTMFNFGLWAAVVLTIIAFIAWMLFSILQVAGDLKGSLRGILGFAAVVVIFLIGYSVTAGEPDSAVVGEAVRKFEEAQATDLTPANLKFIGGGIITSLALIAIAVVALVLAGGRNFFK